MKTLNPMMDFFKKAGREGNEERMRELANAKEKYRLDQASKLKYAERQGIERGVQTQYMQVPQYDGLLSMVIGTVLGIVGLKKYYRN